MVRFNPGKRHKLFTKKRKEMKDKKQRELFRIYCENESMFILFGFSEAKRKEYCEQQYEDEKLFKRDPEKYIEMYFWFPVKIGTGFSGWFNSTFGNNIN